MLKKIRNWLTVLFVMVSTAVGFWIYTENADFAQLVLFGSPLDPQPLGLLIVGTFVTGVMLGLFCNVLTTTWLMFKLRRLQNRIDGLQLKK